MARFCENCGASISETTKFCPSCGSKQTQPQQQPAPIQPPPQPYIQPQPQYAPVYAVPKKKKSMLPIILPIVFLALIGIASLVIFVVLPSTMNAMAERDFYNIANNEVPAVKYILGEKRTVTGVSTAARSDGVKEQTVSYKSKAGESSQQDMLKYATALCDNNGFYAINDNDFSGATGKNFRFAKASKIAGNLVIVQIDYDMSGFTVTLLHGAGTLNIPGGNESKSGNDSALSNNSTSAIDSTLGNNFMQDTTSAPGGNTTEPRSSASAPAPSGGTNALTKGIFDTLGGGTYHMKTKDGAEGYELEIYNKNGLTAMLWNTDGTDIRAVYKDGKCYMISDAEKIILLFDATGVYEAPNIGDNVSGLEYVGSGSEDFYGSSYQYDEYKNSDGWQFFYYVNGGALKGIRIITDGQTSDTIVNAFDTNVPDSIFDVPSDYEVTDMADLS